MAKKMNLIILLLMGIAEFWALFPILWCFLASLKTKEQLFSKYPLFIFYPTFTNYIHLFTELEFQRWIFNSLIMATTSALVATFTGAMAAYALSNRFQFRAKEGLANFILSLRMLPPIVAAVPIFILYKYLNLVNTHLGLTLVYIVFNLPLTIWMMRGFVEELPIEIEDAAMIDGCTRLQTFTKVVLPLTKPALVATFIISFMFAWNELLFAIFLTGAETYTVTVGMTRFVTIKRVDWGSLMAAGMSAMLPVIAIAFYAQRYLIRGLTFGAVKA